MDEGTQPAASGFDIRRIVARGGNLLVLALVAVSLLGAVLLIFRTVEAERTAREQARRTSAVLVELGAINRAVLNAETGQRGYLITFDRRYLDPYRVASEQYRPALERLHALLDSDGTPRQRELLDRVENLTASKFGEMGDSVALVDAGKLLDARAMFLSDEGKEVMGRLRAALRELEVIESEQLADKNADVARAESRLMPLLGALLTLLIITLTLGYRLVGRTAHAEALASQAVIVAEARDRADLLARELNHRVKNLFAVILAIVRMSAKDAPEAKPVAERIAERIHALLAAHEVTQGNGTGEHGADLRLIVETAIKPYLASERRAEIEGPEVTLNTRQVTPLGLVLHELTTNAVKYGCWSSGGLLTVSWRREGDDLQLDWCEAHAGSGATPERTGFGSLLMTSAARQLRGTIERTFAPEGVHVAMRFPLGN